MTQKMSYLFRGVFYHFLLQGRQSRQYLVQLSPLIIINKMKVQMKENALNMFSAYIIELSPLIIINKRKVQIKENALHIYIQCIVHTSLI